MKHLQQRLDAEGVNIICMAIDPGVVSTENIVKWVNSMSFLLGIATRIMAWLAFVPPRYGAMNSVYGAASPEVKASAGRFKSAHLMPVGRITRPSSYATDERLARELYETSIEILKDLNLY